MTASTTQGDTIRRAAGLLVIEVKNSNPNGDPDRESDPRVRSHDQRGMITSVSFKRKLRDLVEDKAGPVWLSLSQELALPEDEFQILESRRTELKEMRELNESEFIRRYWDGRLFGNTELEKARNKKVPIKTGVAQFGLGMSVAPVRVQRMTTTNPAVEEGKSVGMAPLAFRVVEHGVYTMPFFINPTAAVKSGCRGRDIEVMKRLIRYSYAHTPSYIRTAVEIRHAWYAEHKDSLGSFSEFRFMEAMTPRRKGDPEKPSTGNVPLDEEYDIPKDLPDDLKSRVAEGSFRDLCA